MKLTAQQDGRDLQSVEIQLRVEVISLIFFSPDDIRLEEIYDQTPPSLTLKRLPESNGPVGLNHSGTGD